MHHRALPSPHYHAQVLTSLPTHMQTNGVSNKSLNKFHMQCANAPCAQCCPVDAIQINEFGMAELLEDKCINCRLCVYACPYDLIFYDRKRIKVAKCSGCSDLLREGKEAACVSACRRNVIRVCNETELKEIQDELHQIIPEAGMKPRVFYRNLPEK